MHTCAHCGSQSETVREPSAFGSCQHTSRIGYRRLLRAALVTDAELLNPTFLRDGRQSAFNRGVSYRAMLDYLTDALRDYQGDFVERRSGREVFLDMSPLEDAPVHWFRDLIRPCKDNVRPRVRIEAKERWRVALSILRATDPLGECWGAANDNTPLIPSSAP